MKTDQIKIIQDISLLFELSLSVGSTLDPEENCQRFLRTLISRKNLSFGAVWLFRQQNEQDRSADLFYIHPHFREHQNSIHCSPFFLEQLSERPFFTVSHQDQHFEDLVQERKIEKGAYAVFRLGDRGYLKLFASNRPDGFDDIEMAQLKQVIDKFKISLDAGFAHIQLKQETESRLSAQKAQEESEKKLRRIIDSSLDAVLSANEAGLVIEWNAQAEKMLGYKKQEVLGKPVRDIFIPKRHWPLFDAAFETYLKTPDTNLLNERFEIKCIRKDQTEFLAELSVTADIHDKNILFVGFVRDITEPRKVKKQIEQARTRMETLIANLQSGILLEDQEGKIVLVNKAFCSQFEIPLDPELLIGMNGNEAVEHCRHLFFDPEAFIQSRNRIMQDKQLVTNEVFRLTSALVLERDYIPLFSGDEHEGHLWQFRDITERQLTEEAIRESEEKYRGVLENMELGLLEVDLEDNILHANNSFCQMLGYCPEEIVGQNAGRMFLDEQSQEIITERLQERKEGRAGVYEIRMQRKDGTPIWGLVSGAPIKNAHGQIVGSIGIQFDLTDRKKLENELAEAKQIADRARLAERQFLTHMSHEIRTPINAVIGMAHLLDETHPDATQKDYLNGLRFSADSLLGIIDNILDLSKIDAGELEFEQKTFDLKYLLKSLLQTMQFKIGHKSLEIKDDIDPGIENLVVGDPTRLNQILTNLLGNALKFTEKGEIRLSAEVLHNSGTTYAMEFRVRDTGIGIPLDKRDTIFEYFKQADVKINRKFGGTGLGLTIVKQLLEKQGGSIRVESEPGLGSDFIFTLQLGNSGIPVRQGNVHRSAAFQSAASFPKGLHFLIVEDNALNQKLICKTIETWECSYEVAHNGLEALSKTAAQRFDVIVMDIHMPGLDGFETTLAIRRDGQNPNQHIPIIALTAAAMSDDKRRAFETGMNVFLTKPIAPKILQEHILNAIQEFHSGAPGQVELAVPTALIPQAPDLDYLLRLSNGDHHFVADILHVFLLETPLNLENLERLAAAEDWAGCAALLHRLKPNLAMVGLNQLEKQALFLEAILQQSKPAESAGNLIGQLVRQTRQFLPLLELEKNRLVV